MRRVADAGSSSWHENMAANGTECHVPWWVWQISVQSGDTKQTYSVSVGDNELPLSPGLCAQRSEPVRTVLPSLRGYEVSQLSVITFLICFLAAVILRAPSFIAAPLLCLIPMCRICPELPLLRPGIGTVPRAVRILLRCCLALWIVLLSIYFLKLRWSVPAASGRAPAAEPPEIRLPGRKPVQPWPSLATHPAPPGRPLEESPALEALASSSMTAGSLEEDPEWVPQHLPPCYLKDAKYEPLNMPGQVRTRARTAEECQARCARTPGCAYFTLLTTHNGQKGCHLQEYRSRLVRATRGTVAGPGDCDQEALLASALGTPAQRAPPPIPPVPPPVRPRQEQVPPHRVKSSWSPEEMVEPPSPRELGEVKAADKPNLGADGSLVILVMGVVVGGVVTLASAAQGVAR
mmetsp:Transcript_42191/g.78478  ORF Transcript_42191/g.78478 Transcript_42191/m.78478 type:complete len:406 (+) Transcript_42191:47-1264(+)